LNLSRTVRAGLPGIRCAASCPCASSTQKRCRSFSSIMRPASEDQKIPRLPFLHKIDKAGFFPPSTMLLSLFGSPPHPRQVACCGRSRRFFPADNPSPASSDLARGAVLHPTRSTRPVRESFRVERPTPPRPRERRATVFSMLENLGRPRFDELMGSLLEEHPPPRSTKVFDDLSQGIDAKVLVLPRGFVRARPRARNPACWRLMSHCPPENRPRRRIPQAAWVKSAQARRLRAQDPSITAHGTGKMSVSVSCSREKFGDSPMSRPVDGQTGRVVAVFKLTWSKQREARFR